MLDITIKYIQEKCAETFNLDGAGNGLDHGTVKPTIPVCT